MKAHLITIAVLAGIVLLLVVMSVFPLVGQIIVGGLLSVVLIDFAVLIYTFILEEVKEYLR